MDERGIAVVVSRKTILASGVVYVKEGDAIHGIGEAVVVGDGAGLGEEVGDEVGREGRESKVPHVGVSNDGENGECGYDVRQGV